MNKPLVEKEEDETTSKRNRVAKSAREATKCTKKEKDGKPEETYSLVVKKIA